MLQRAASNAYTYWWASHIRTKQSKWLEQALQDMEDKVKYTRKLIEEDGDSFAKRAEMYYRKRPELLNFLEESIRAYRALAERYNHISGELQNANNTIATVFPDQVQFSMDDEDDDNSPRVANKPQPDTDKVPKAPLPEAPKLNIPKLPKIPKKDVKGLLTSSAKKPKSRLATTPKATSSRMTTSEAQKQIDKLQKGILALQTEKEFVMGSYESALGKYLDIEKRIEEMQQEVCGLQDEFDVQTVIEDEEAQSLMAATALKSCQDTLVQLLEKQERASEEAKAEYQRVKDAHEKLENLKGELLFPNNNPDHETKLPTKTELTNPAGSSLKRTEQGVEVPKQEVLELEAIREKIKEHFETDTDTSLTVTEMAEKIDELVTKVISLETAVSSQTALIKRLRSETDELHADLHSLEEDKSSLVKDSTNLSSKLKKLEEELHAVQDLNKNFEDQNNNLQTHFTEANCNLDHLFDKLQTVRYNEEEVEVADVFQTEDDVPLQIERDNELEAGEGIAMTPPNDSKTENQQSRKMDDGVRSSPSVIDKEVAAVIHSKCKSESYVDGLLGKCQVPTQKDEVKIHDILQTAASINDKLDEQEKDRDPVDLQKLLSNGLDDREKILLSEYTSILRNYKEAKRKLSDVEKKSRDSIFETMVQVRELKSSNAIKDEEIQSLRQKLNFLQTDSDGNNETQATSAKEKSHDGDAQEGQASRHTTLSEQFAGESNSRSEESPASGTAETSQYEGDDKIKMILVDKPRAFSTIEEKFRRDIDELLEENLDFWLRFSTSFHQIQKFQTATQDLKTEIYKLKANKKQDGSSDGSHKKGEGSTDGSHKKGEKEGSSHHADRSSKSEARPIYKHLLEIQTELTVWLEKSALLKEELQQRFSSLCDIQEEISKVLKLGEKGEDVEITNYQAAKFQGEVLNMKQENNKVADELQAGLDHVNTLQLEIEKTLTKLNDEYKLSGSKHHSSFGKTQSKPRIPLRSFLFNSKPKNKKPSIFLCINPILHKHNDSGGGLDS